MSKYQCDDCLKKTIQFGCAPKFCSAYTSAVNTHGKYFCAEFIDMGDTNRLPEIKRDAIKNKAEAMNNMTDTKTKTGKKYGLDELAKSWGMSEDEMLNQATTDSVAAAICTECGYTTNMEPDQDAGWCSDCKQNTVVSCLVLAGLI